MGDIADGRRSGSYRTGVLSVKDGFLQASFAQIIGQRSSSRAQELGERMPAPGQECDGRTETGIGLDEVIVQLLGAAGSQFFHDGPTVLLMESQTLLRR